MLAKSRGWQHIFGELYSRCKVVLLKDNIEEWEKIPCSKNKSFTNLKFNCMPKKTVEPKKNKPTKKKSSAQKKADPKKKAR